MKHITTYVVKKRIVLGRTDKGRPSTNLDFRSCTIDFNIATLMVEEAIKFNKKIQYLFDNQKVLGDQASTLEGRKTIFDKFI